MPEFYKRILGRIFRLLRVFEQVSCQRPGRILVLLDPLAVSSAHDTTIYAAGHKWLQICAKYFQACNRLVTLYPYMSLSEKELQRFRTLLLSRQQSLLQADESADEAEQIVELDQTRIGRLSRMDALQAQAMSVATGRRRRQGLTSIDAALMRIADHAFGDCFECGKPINPKRLAADPAATLCINCAEALE